MKIKLLAVKFLLAVLWFPHHVIFPSKGKETEEVEDDPKKVDYFKKGKSKQEP